MAIILIPNIIFRIRNKNYESRYKNKVIEIIEQIGRFGSMAFMIFNIPVLSLGGFMELNIFFSKIATQLQLGNLLSEAATVHGGFMHTMHKLDTDTGTYIIKLLNPNVMKRSEAIENYAESDRLEGLLEENDIPIIPSLFFNDKKMQKIDEQYFYVFKWYDGKTIKGREITKLHCHKISEVLSRIHHIDMINGEYKRKPININWDYYIKLAEAQSKLIFELLNENRTLLYESQNIGNTAILKVPAIVSVCHNDMDSKNVLWLDDNLKIIDLECLRYSNPYIELFELALCWSGYEECNIDFVLFSEFIDTYFKDNPKPSIDWKAIYYSNKGRLEWLEYNVKRALLIECTTIEEQELGIAQVKETIEHVIYYDKVKDKILQCLAEIFMK